MSVRFGVAGAAAGAASAFLFAAVHHLLISNIWFSVVPMMIAGAICGASLVWTYLLLFDTPGARTWFAFNTLHVVMFALLGAASVLVFEPVTTMAAAIAANAPPTALIRRALPMTAAFTLLWAATIMMLWARSARAAVAVCVTCLVLVVLLGLNISAIGLVEIPRSSLFVIVELVGLTAALILVYAALFWAVLRAARMAGPGETNEAPRSGRIAAPFG